MNSKIKSFIEKIIPARYLEFFNSNVIILTKRPNQGHVISDLFLMRIEDDWETFFECIQINKILNPIKDPQNNSVKIYFHNSQGEFIGEKTLSLNEDHKITLNINEIANEIGINRDATFTLFHSNNTKWLSEFNSFTGDRGYTGYYNLKKGSIKSFIHGNLDAISYSNNKIKLLGNYSFTYKNYIVQHLFDSNFIYELFWVNSTNSKQKFTIIEIKASGEKSTSFIINPKGILKFIKKIDEARLNSQIIIKSKLYLARPMIFKIMPDSFDVFHG
jgi:hypothetical protein|tara:strand:+ start:12320 stop:13141 length:822 start_codon:yes stop_codon:yes gene_type:complete